MHYARPIYLLKVYANLYSFLCVHFLKLCSSQNVNVTPRSIAPCVTEDKVIGVKAMDRQVTQFVERTGATNKEARQFLQSKLFAVAG